MKKNTSIFLFLIIISSINLFSQVTQEWVRIYSGMGYHNTPTAMSVDAAGNVYVAGYSGTSVYSESYDYILIKYNTSGVKLFDTRFNGFSNNGDIPYAMAYDGSYIYMTGETHSQPRTQILTLKLNTNGQIIWSRYYLDSNYISDVGTSVAYDQTGNVYVAGYSEANQHIFNLKTIKYTASGNLVWAKTYTDRYLNPNAKIGIKTDASGNSYVSSSCLGASTYSWNIITIKYNSAGQRIWAIRHDSADIHTELAKNFCLSPSGNFYVTGYRTITSNSVSISVIGYNPAGQEQVNIIYPPVAFMGYYPRDIFVDAHNNLFITGYSESGYHLNFLTFKYDVHNNLVWDEEYIGYSYYNEAISLACDRFGSVYVTGISTTLNNSYSEDFATVKYDSNGYQKWVMRYNGPSNLYDEPVAIGLDNNNNVYITGLSNVEGIIQNIATIKYSQPIGIKPILSEVPNKFSLFQNYPNPFNPVTKIKFSLPTVGQRHAFDVRLIVYDILGRGIAVLVNEQLSPGIYEVEWDGTNLPSGVYFYKLITEGYSETKKMVLLK